MKMSGTAWYLMTDILTIYTYSIPEITELHWNPYSIYDIARHAEPNCKRIIYPIGIIEIYE